MTSSKPLQLSTTLMCLLWALACCLAASSANAATDTAAVVLFSHGKVTVVNAAGTHALEKGDNVIEGDMISTGTDGRVQMRFTDGGLVSLTPGSSFAVTQYNQPTANSGGSLVFNLVKGGLRTISGTIGGSDAPDDYKLKTAVATLGIRGTKFVVSMYGAMRVHVDKGAVELINDLGSLTLNADQSGVVTPGHAPELTLLQPQLNGGGSASTAPQQKSVSDGTVGNDLLGNGNLARSLTVAFLTNSSLSRKNILDAIAQLDIAQDGPSGSNSSGYASLAGFAVTSASSIEYTNGSNASEGVPTSASMDKATWQQIVGSSTNSPVIVPAILPTNAAPGGSVTEAPPVVNVTGGLVWGETAKTLPNNGDNDPTNDLYHPTIYQSYAWGEPATNLPTTGVLHYQLAEATVGRDMRGPGSFTLSQFDMDVKLHPTNDPEFHLEMAFGTGANPWPTFTMDQGRFIQGSWTGPASFEAALKGKVGQTVNASDCTGCTVNIAGILVGSGGTQAGVNYRYLSSDAHVSGAAILDKVP